MSITLTEKAAGGATPNVIVADYTDLPEKGLRPEMLLSIGQPQRDEPGRLAVWPHWAAALLFQAATSDSTARDSVSGDPGDETIDQIIAEDGIQVKGKPSTTEHGYLTTTVSGTGTPGDHIVLDARDGNAEVPYITALYPQLAT
ncbi:hypothetical protein B4Q13_20270, partial [Lacticaseibacillus rhamnosus]